MAEDVWRRTIDINLTGTYLMSREVVNHFLATGNKGRIVNIVSQAAFNGSATGKAHYAASKAGVVAFTVSLAQEVAKEGIRVNAVAPGMMLTEMTRETLEKNRDKYREKIPLGRVADLDEVADVVAFVASDKASYMTGATVDVSGGMLLR
jgi:3-oxoacyl-[acyl-carrier protein] reductase